MRLCITVCNFLDKGQGHLIEMHGVGLRLQAWFFHQYLVIYLLAQKVMGVMGVDHVMVSGLGMVDDG